MTFTERIVGAAKLNVAAYEEVEADKSATGQAMLVVVLSSIAIGFGQIREGISGMVIGTIGSLLIWYVWAYLNYFIGTKFFPEPETKADHGELLRTLGFATAPRLLWIFGVIPYSYLILTVVVNIWMLVTTVVAVRQALDYKSTGRAVGVVMLGWLVQAVATTLLFVLLPDVAH